MMMDAFVLLVLPTFNSATVCMSRAVPTMLITIAQLDAVTQEDVLAGEMVKRSHRASV